MAGTTVEDPGNVATCFLNAFAKEKIEMPPLEVNKVMGYRKRDAIKFLLKNFHAANGNLEVLTDRIHASFTNSMVKFYKSTSSLNPLPYAEDIFDKLRGNGIRVALNTGFTKPITDAILSKLNWDEQVIDAVVSSDEVAEGRPAPAMIFELMNRLKVLDSTVVIKIGDTAVDILEGRNAGCGLVIGITSGAYTRSELAASSPDHIIDSLEQLPELIK